MMFETSKMTRLEATEAIARLQTFLVLEIFAVSNIIL